MSIVNFERLFIKLYMTIFYLVCKNKSIQINICRLPQLMLASVSSPGYNQSLLLEFQHSLYEQFNEHTLQASVINYSSIQCSPAVVQFGTKPQPEYCSCFKYLVIKYTGCPGIPCALTLRVDQRCLSNFDCHNFACANIRHGDQSDT